MNNFAILAGNLTESTLWGESKDVKILFMTMLSKANRDGIIYSTVYGIAHLARLTIEETEQALKVLESPDAKNPKQEYEGRRIETLPDGWRLLNHRKYIEKAKALSERAYKTQWAKEKRAKDRAFKAKSQPMPGEGTYDRIHREQGQPAADAWQDAQQKAADVEGTQDKQADADKECPL